MNKRSYTFVTGSVSQNGRANRMVLWNKAMRLMNSIRTQSDRASFVISEPVDGILYAVYTSTPEDRKRWIGIKVKDYAEITRKTEWRNACANFETANAKSPAWLIKTIKRECEAYILENYHPAPSPTILDGNTEEELIRFGEDKQLYYLWRFKHWY